ncbi:hypothetical protein AB0B50_16295 [Streptomyces sp. NPDC041068]|uniref:hypothetical protein n=1 Tax=Streptomyces sp. NPDC041068 TaxID=3155130 RepID=UPI0033E0CAB8
MNDNRELIAYAREMIAEVRALADETITLVAEQVAQETGEQIVARHPGIMDARFGDLTRMGDQARAYREALRIIRQWLLPSDQRRLGDLLKVVPPDVAEEITTHLRAAGVLPEG